MPVVLTVACAVLEELQVPPVEVSDSVMEAFWQTVVGPVMAPTVAAGLTVMGAVAVAVPQLLVTE